MNIRPVGAELFHADGQTDSRQILQKLIFLAILVLRLKKSEIMGCIYFSTYITVDIFSGSPVALPNSAPCHCSGNTERAGRIVVTANWTMTSKTVLQLIVCLSCISFHILPWLKTTKFCDISRMLSCYKYVVFYLMLQHIPLSYCCRVCIERNLI